MDYDSIMSELQGLGINPAGVNVQYNADNGDDSVIDRLSEITGVIYSDEQRAILKTRGSGVILSCAGSGKTTVTNHLICKRIMTGEISNPSSVICTTFSKAGATELGARLKNLMRLCGLNGSVDVRTMHSFFLEIIKTMGVNRGILKESQRMKFIRESCKELELEYKDEDFDTISTMISFQVNELMPPADVVRRFSASIDNMDTDTFTRLVSKFANKKQAANSIDYDDMQLFVYMWLCVDRLSNDPQKRESSLAIRRYCKGRYAEFYIDEAQDTSKIQFEIIKCLATDDSGKLDKTIVFVGDDDQVVYRWRGANPMIIMSVGPMFNIPVKLLSTNYRCKSEIVNFAANGVKHSSARTPKGMTAFANGGSVKIYRSASGSLVDMSAVTVHHINNLIDNGYGKDEIAILVRNNMHAMITVNMLLHQGIHCEYTEKMSLTKANIYKDAKGIVQMSNTAKRSTDVTEFMLWKLVKYLRAKDADMFTEIMTASKSSFVEVLGCFLTNFTALGIKPVKKITLPMGVYESVRLRWNRLKADTIQSLVELYAALTIPEDNKRVSSLGNIYLENTAFMYKSSDKRRTVTSLITYFCMLVHKNGVEDTLSFLELVEQMESGDFKATGKRITVSTIHGAKGKEWKAVIALACDNISMPSLDSIGILLSNKATMTELNEYIDEERRLHYVEMTRAKENLLIVTAKEPSIFTMECLGLLDNVAECNSFIIDSVGERRSITELAEQFEQIVGVNERERYNHVVVKRDLADE